jgi:hypothetical protein
MLGRKPADIDMDATMKEIDEDGSQEVRPGYLCLNALEPPLQGFRENP